MSDATSFGESAASETETRRKWFIVITKGPNQQELDKAFRKGEEVQFTGRYSESPHYYRAGDEEVLFSARIKYFYPDPPAKPKSIWDTPRQKFAVIADIDSRVVSLTPHFDPSAGTGHIELPLNW